MSVVMLSISCSTVDCNSAMFDHEGLRQVQTILYLTKTFAVKTLHYCNPLSYVKCLTSLLTFKAVGMSLCHIVGCDVLLAVWVKHTTVVLVVPPQASSGEGGAVGPESLTGGDAGWGTSQTGNRTVVWSIHLSHKINTLVYSIPCNQTPLRFPSSQVWYSGTRWTDCTHSPFHSCQGPPHPPPFLVPPPHSQQACYG